MVPCKRTAEEVSFEWSLHRISFTDSNIRTTLHVSIIDSGNERDDRVKEKGDTRVHEARHFTRGRGVNERDRCVHHKRKKTWTSLLARILDLLRDSRLNLSKTYQLSICGCNRLIGQHAARTV